LIELNIIELNFGGWINFVKFWKPGTQNGDFFCKLATKWKVLNIMMSTSFVHGYDDQCLFSFHMHKDFYDTKIGHMV
jgi:hypothetical protein